MDVSKKQELIDLFNEIAVKMHEAGYRPSGIFRFYAESFVILVSGNLDLSPEEYCKISSHMDAFTNAWLDVMEEQILLMVKKHEQNNLRD
jgi:hypothetical protein